MIPSYLNIYFIFCEFLTMELLTIDRKSFWLSPVLRIPGIPWNVYTMVACYNAGHHLWQGITEHTYTVIMFSVLHHIYRLFAGSSLCVHESKNVFLCNLVWYQHNLQIKSIFSDSKRRTMGKAIWIRAVIGFRYVTMYHVF